MKKLTLFITAIIISLNVQSQNTWNMLHSMTVGTGYTASFAIGNSGYIVSGVNDVDYSNSTWEYNTITDAWTQKADAGTILRNGPAGFAINGKGYMGMGIDNSGNILDDLMQYDATLNSWIQKANIIQGRFDPAVMVIGSRVFVSCGAVTDFLDVLLNDTWEYDVAADNWIQRASFPASKRFACSGFSINGYGYLMGGADSLGDNINNDLWQYDPVFDIWVQKSDLPSDPRAGASSFTIGNFGFIGAGVDQFFSHSDFWKYDGINDVWSQVASLPTTGRDGPFSFVVNGKAYVGGGFDDNTNSFSDTWRYTPDSNVGIAESPFIEASLNIYPNPVVNSFSLSVQNFQAFKNLQLNVYDYTGKLQETIIIFSDNEVIDFSSFPAGIYFCELSNSERILTTKKIVKL